MRTRSSSSVPPSRRDPDAPCLITTDGSLTFAQVDEQSDALASCFVDAGVLPGDRVALYLQNDPQFVTALVGIWKAAAIAVPINPMLLDAELRYILDNAEPTVLVARADLVATAMAAARSSSIELVLTTSGTLVAPAPTTRLDATDGDPRMLDLDAVSAARSAPVTTRPSIGTGDPAFLVYTSGTTGRPKGTVNHRERGAQRRGVLPVDRHGPGRRDPGGAPLFHITGLVAGIALSHRARCPLVLLHRFEAGACLDSISRWRCSMTVMSLTAYIALMAHEQFDSTDLTSMTKAYSGGAPVSPAVADRWERSAGVTIRNVYGLTETTSPTHMTPWRQEGRVHPELGAYAVGVPVPGADVRAVDLESGQNVPVGERGELVVRGPMVVPAYWRRSDPVGDEEGWFHTGDVGLMDDDGWFYVVDRQKDMINASGFKVWPREVEDVLRSHSDVRDAAVIGVADDYRGETVKAFVTLRAPEAVETTELLEFCRQRLAAYKRPRSIEVVVELPTSAAGEVLRGELCDREHTSREQAARS